MHQQLRPHPVQSALWRTKAKRVAVCAGRGSGKTELARRYVVRWLPVERYYPDGTRIQDPMYFYMLPTYMQARRVAWDQILRLIPKQWIKGEPNKSDLFVKTIFGSTLYVIGMDKPARAEGNQWDGGVIDESSDQRPGMFAKTVEPMLTHRDAWCWRIGVPKRFGVGAPEFRAFFKKCQDAKDEKHRAYTWSTEDILSQDQLAIARENLDQRDYNEQIRGMWEESTGAMFYAFSEVLNVRRDIVYDPKKPLLIGSDFNVNPMAWVVAQEQGDEVWVLDEVWLRDTNTPAALNNLFTRYGKHEAGFGFYGDAAAAQRKTSASKSDYLHILNDKRFKSAKVYYPKSNPRIADRVASTNALLCNVNGHRRCLIHPRCTNLIADLLARQWKPDGSGPDDFGDIGHITDALGYLIWQKHPMRLDVNTEKRGIYIVGA